MTYTADRLHSDAFSLTGLMKNTPFSNFKVNLFVVLEKRLLHPGFQYFVDKEIIGNLNFTRDEKK